MSDLEKLAALRVGRLDSNLDAKPIDLLRAAAHDVETGSVRCSGVLILFVDSAQESWDVSTMRAGLRWNDELTALQLELFRHTWRQFREGT